MTLWGGLSSGFQSLQDTLQDAQSKLQESVAAYQDDPFPVPDLNQRQPGLVTSAPPAPPTAAQGQRQPNVPQLPPSAGGFIKLEDPEDHSLNAYLRAQHAGPGPGSTTPAAGRQPLFATSPSAATSDPAVASNLAIISGGVAPPSMGAASSSSASSSASGYSSASTSSVRAAAAPKSGSSGSLAPLGSAAGTAGVPAVAAQGTAPPPPAPPPPPAAGGAGSTTSGSIFPAAASTNSATTTANVGVLSSAPPAPAAPPATTTLAGAAKIAAGIAPESSGSSTTDGMSASSSSASGLVGAPGAPPLAATSAPAAANANPLQKQAPPTNANVKQLFPPAAAAASASPTPPPAPATIGIVSAKSAPAPPPINLVSAPTPSTSSTSPVKLLQASTSSSVAGVPLLGTTAGAPGVSGTGSGFSPTARMAAAPPPQHPLDPAATMMTSLMQQQMREAQEKIRHQEQRITQLQHQNQLWQDQLQQTNQLHSTLKAQFRDVEKELKSAKERGVEGQGLEATAQRYKQQAEEIRVAFDAFQGQVEDERKESQKQIRTLEGNAVQLQNRLDRQAQKMRDLEANYASASAPLQKRVAELEQNAKSNSYELQQTIEELNADLAVQEAKRKEMEKEISRWREQLSEAQATIVEREREIEGMKQSDKLEIETLKKALQQLQMTQSQQGGVALPGGPASTKSSSRSDAGDVPFGGTTNSNQLRGLSLPLVVTGGGGGGGSASGGVTTTASCSADDFESENLLATSTAHQQQHLHRTLAADGEGSQMSPSDKDCLRQQNAHLKSEILALREQLAAAVPSEVAELQQPPEVQERDEVQEQSATGDVGTNRRRQQAAEDSLIDSWFQQDAVNLTLENDRLKAEHLQLEKRFEKALQVIGRLQEEMEQLRSSGRGAGSMTKSR